MPAARKIPVAQGASEIKRLSRWGPMQTNTHAAPPWGTHARKESQGSKAGKLQTTPPLGRCKREPQAHNALWLIQA